MNDIRNGKVYAALFLFGLVLLGVGGYFVTFYLTKDSSTQVSIDNQKEVAEENKTQLIDSSLDAIYFQNIDIKSEKQGIIYQDVVININSEDAKTLEEELNDKMDTLKSSFLTISSQDLEGEDKKIIFKDDDIYEANYFKYITYFYKNYASLLVLDYTFNCFEGSNYLGSQAYVFDVTDGKILNENEILNLYSKTKEDIKNMIKEELNKDILEDETILIEETLNNLDGNYALYINKSGFLTISYLVKTQDSSYNDVIVFN